MYSFRPKIHIYRAFYANMKQFIPCGEVARVSQCTLMLEGLTPLGCIFYLLKKPNKIGRRIFVIHFSHETLFTESYDREFDPI